MRYWIFKSEGDCYGIDDFKKDKKTMWTGVRNYQARNFMMVDMSIGDIIFFYHSNGKKQSPTGVYGLGKVSSVPQVDPTQFDQTDEHFDLNSKKEKPLWWCVEVSFVKKFKKPITLTYIKTDVSLSGIIVAQVGSRLSIQPVSQKHGEYIVSISE